LEILHVKSHTPDLSPISELENLKKLKNQTLSCNLKDLSPVSGLKNLEVIDTGWVHVDNISPVSELNNLKELRITTTSEIDSMAPLSNLDQLEALQLKTPADMAYGPPSTYNMSSLTGSKENLRVLILSGNKIREESYLANLTNLEVLDIGRCDINDFSFLAELRDLENLQRVELRRSKLDYEAVEYIEKLKEEGIEVPYHEHLTPGNEND